MALTLLTVLSIVTVITVYAVLIGTYTGGQVTVLGGAANIRYSNSTGEAGPWAASSISSSVSAPWFSRLEFANGGYSGPVTITWHLEKNEATWTDVTGATVSTTVLLTGAAQYVYATTDGLSTANHNWGLDNTGAGAYRVIVDVESA